MDAAVNKLMQSQGNKSFFRFETVGDRLSDAPLE
jgi:hypothetical protein